ncbi:hypothetical protein [Clostridium cylindrosporum]|uniref:Uncharacterized protein n=1 Tax=Clostridium cylindrosporum DSM 605 TaxID=1121307 RepID=A0A0J8DFK7_CLOCY|nr:hypothetical protein [Clostridium cylindrosporum]KMT22963.1 hypothetical protein CLCY_7c00100 [Clostridium cylindrosporum DSM 605]
MVELSPIEKEALKRTILGRLKEGLRVSPNQMDMDKVTYDVIKNNSMFAGDPRNIQLTTKGEQEARENNYTINFPINLERLEQL